MTTFTTTEYRAGWFSDDGAWHAFTAGGTHASRAEAEADMAELVVRYGSALHSSSPITRACKAGRVEVRTRVVTRTDWERPGIRSFDGMENDERWAGFGYLGGRRNELDSSDPEHTPRPELVAEVDRLILERVQREGWTDEELFAWANSKSGRWLADTAFGGGRLTDADWNRTAGSLLRKVEA